MARIINILQKRISIVQTLNKIVAKGEMKKSVDCSMSGGEKHNF
jgi:hypothetical protein